MRFSSLITSRRVEVCVGTLLLLTSANALRDGMPFAALASDVGLFIVFLIGVFRPVLGTALLIAMVPLSLILDPVNDGIGVYMVLFLIVDLVRTERFRLAGAATFAVAVLIGVSTGRRLGFQEWHKPAFLFFALAALAWLIGLGFRASRRQAARQVEQEFREREVRLVGDLHDVVSRNLAATVLQLEAHKAAGNEWTPFLEGLEERIRLANTSVRDLTNTLRSPGFDATPPPALAEAISCGIRDLQAVGFAVRPSPDDPSLHPQDLPDDVEAAASRIMGEALHNVAKHGDPAGPCVVLVESTTDQLQLTVVNRILPGRPHGEPTLGLLTMQRHATALGGTFEAAGSDDSWSVHVTLPLTLGMVTP